MLTACPACHMQFRIRARDLRAARGRVRCGACGHTFDALFDLRDDDESDLPPVLTDAVGPEDLPRPPLPVPGTGIFPRALPSVPGTVDSSRDPSPVPGTVEEFPATPVPGTATHIEHAVQAGDEPAPAEAEPGAVDLEAAIARLPMPLPAEIEPVDADAPLPAAAPAPADGAAALSVPEPAPVAFRIEPAEFTAGAEYEPASSAGQDVPDPEHDSRIDQDQAFQAAIGEPPDIPTFDPWEPRLPQVEAAPGSPTQSEAHAEVRIDLAPDAQADAGLALPPGPRDGFPPWIDRPVPGAPSAWYDDAAPGESPAWHHGAVTDEPTAGNQDAVAGEPSAWIDGDAHRERAPWNAGAAAGEPAAWNATAAQRDEPAWRARAMADEPATGTGATPGTNAPAAPDTAADAGAAPDGTSEAGAVPETFAAGQHAAAGDPAAEPPPAADRPLAAEPPLAEDSQQVQEQHPGAAPQPGVASDIPATPPPAAEPSVTAGPGEDRDPSMRILLDELPTGRGRYRFDDDAAPAAPPSRARRVWIALAVVLVVLLASQAAWGWREQLFALMPQARPLAQRLCTTLGCRIDVPRALDRLRVIARDVRDHPRLQDALLVNATIENQADFRQPYPVLELSLFDVNGGLLGRRRFQPREYLDSSVDRAAGMAVKVPVIVVMEVAGPTDQAVSFEFKFL